MYAIWIGNRLPQNIDLNTLDIQHYLTSGSCCIKEFSAGMPTEINRLFNKFGGTILLFTHLDGMVIYGFKNHGTSNYEEINSKYLAGGIEYLDRTVARVRYGNPSEYEAHCSRVIMADCTFMITYNYQPKVSTMRNIINLRKEMLTYLANNQIVKFIQPEPILKQMETEKDYVRERSVPTLVNIPTSLNRSNSSSTNSSILSNIDLGNVASAAIGAGVTAAFGSILG